MTPKEIARLAGRIFQDSVPANWAIRSQEDQEDYGIDYEIELTTADDKATGFIFKAQQKGALELSQNAASDKVVFSGLKVERMKYYLEQIKIPIVFVVVETNSRSIYWTVLKGNPTIEGAYRAAVQNHQTTLSIEIPIANKLPDTAERLLKRINDSQDALLIRQLQQVSSDRLLTAAAREVNFDELAKSMRRHADIFRMESIERLLQEGKLQEAFDGCATIFSSPSETVETRFSAGLNVLRIQGGASISDPNPNRAAKLLETRFVVCHSLLRIVRPRSVPAELRTYARVLASIARLGVHAEKWFGLAMSLLAQGETGSALSHLLTEELRRKVVITAFRELERTQRGLVRIIRRGHFGVLPQALAHAAPEALRLITSLRLQKLPDAANHIRNWFDKLGELAYAAASALKRWSDVNLIAFTLMTLADLHDANDVNTRVDAAKERVNTIPDEILRQVGLEDIAATEEMFSEASKEPGDKHDIEMYSRMATAMGIDLDDPNDDVSRIVRIGLRDLNPERVLKNCEYLHVSLDFCGLPAQMLGLTTAGSKWVNCTKFGHGIMGLSLDDTYETFCRQYCKSCKECKPRPSDWKWTREWQEQQDEEHREIADRGRSFQSRRDGNTVPLEDPLDSSKHSG